MARRSYYYVSVPVQHTFSISGPSSIQGKHFDLTALFDGNPVPATWSITAGNNYATINQNGRVFVEAGDINNSITVSASYTYGGTTYTATKTITVTYDNQFVIEALSTIYGSWGAAVVMFNDEDVTRNPNVTYTVTSGGNHIEHGSVPGTVGSACDFDIVSSGTITIQASYLGYTAAKTIELVYDDNSSMTIGQNENGGVTMETTTETTDPNTGDTTTETTTIVTNGDGSSSTTTTTTTTASDGSSFSSSTTENSDGTSSETTSTTTAPDPNTGSTTTTSQTTNSDGTSSESETTNNTDGSFSSTTTNYDENGDPTSGENVEGDSDGNVSTQEVGYDQSGNEIITGYNIDTSGDSDGAKTFNQNGVNTDFYGFDVTDGFILDMHFTYDFSHQPADQNENHHNILTMKRANPTPWYGFQLRQTGTTKNIILGTQFSTGGNTNTTIYPNYIQGSNSISEYHIRIVYDPSSSGYKFICRELVSDTTVSTSNLVFPDVPELEYLSVCIGHAQDTNGDPYRYSNIDLYDFQLIKLSRIATPVITCEGTQVDISCTTPGVNIYYRTGGSGSFSLYTAPFSINSTTLVEAYSELSSRTTATVSETCVYNPPTLYAPSITCNGTHVTITCATQGATIYYRLGSVGNYSTYTSPIAINSDVTVYAYSTLGVQTSSTVTENCVYNFEIEAPTIYCDGEYVSIVCDTPSVTIWYRLGNDNYSEYIDSFAINATTTVEAYAELNGHYSTHTTETCTYNPIVLATPVITCNGEQVTITCTTQNATILYSLDGGTYTTYTNPITISADTVVEAYSTIHGRISSVATENCIYNPVHDYSQDYLTFRVLTAGTIIWKANGSGYERTIDYSINNGTWTSITATTGGVSIQVAQDDVVRFRGANNTYAGDKNNYSGFEGGTATYNIEGNIHSLLYGDNFAGNNTLPNYNYIFCSIFKLSNAVSAENLILPATSLKTYCYRAMFSKAYSLVVPPTLSATTLAQGCYYYMFEACPFTDAPELLVATVSKEAYYCMFIDCSNLNYIKCLATSLGSSSTTNWVKNVAGTGTFVKDGNMSNWSVNNVNGIPPGWTTQNDSLVMAPVISYDGFDTITLSCPTQGATVYYRLGNGSYSTYSQPITISDDTHVDAYSTLNGNTSTTTSENCMYVSNVPVEAANRDITHWSYGGQDVTTPYSVNRVDGHSSSYAKGTFNFETSFALREVQPTYLWFQHADQSAAVYIDNVLVEKHWGGYNAFFVDISNSVHLGTNQLKVALKNNEGNNLAPAAGDFNFNATLGNVKLLTSPCLPDMDYGYDGFHVTADVHKDIATMFVRTTVPTDTEIVLEVVDTNGIVFSNTVTSDGSETEFEIEINDPHLWHGTTDPYMYTITMQLWYNGDMYHEFTRDYGLRFYEYVIDEPGIIQNQNYTGFLLNGEPYYLRGVCMHDDLAGKANALNNNDYIQEFDIIRELGCNFIRLAHYPHPKEVYDMCDRMGIIVQTEVPCVNKMQSTMPADYYTHLDTQYTEMVNQHYNHPCIMFWGLSNETTTDDKTFAKAKIEHYTQLIKDLDSERLVGYVMSHSYENPSGYYNNPNVDWFGCNIYTGWYIDQNSNNPSTRLNTRINNTITYLGKALAYSEYGCGGTQHCHSDDFMTTTTRGNNPRHDIEYQMWLHEGQLAAIRNYPQLLFTAEWQLFDIAVANRNEGYTVCLDGETATTDDSLRRLNNKGLVERDHVTKKDTFYLYKAEWNQNDKFVHICGKDYTKMTDRAIKCYTNDGSTLTMSVNNGQRVEQVTVTDHIAVFPKYDFQSGDVVTVTGSTTSDMFTFA